MDDAKGLIEAYVPTAFLWAVLMVIGGILLSFGTAFAGGLLGLALSSSLAIVWLAAGLLVFAVAFYVFWRLVEQLQAQAQHRREIETKHADALLREPVPAPFVVEERPIVVNNQTLPEAPRTINGVPEVAFEYFVAQLCRGVPHTQRKWEGLELPGGYLLGSFDTYDRLITPLVAIGAIVDRTGQDGGNRPGKLIVREPQVILSRLREWEDHRVSARIHS